MANYGHLIELVGKRMEFFPPLPGHKAGTNICNMIMSYGFMKSVNGFHDLLLAKVFTGPVKDDQSNGDLSTLSTVIEGIYMCHSSLKKQREQDDLSWDIFIHELNNHQEKLLRMISCLDLNPTIWKEVVHSASQFIGYALNKLQMFWPLVYNQSFTDVKQNGYLSSSMIEIVNEMLADLYVLHMASQCDDDVYRGLGLQGNSTRLDFIFDLFLSDKSDDLKHFESLINKAELEICINGLKERMNEMIYSVPSWTSNQSLLWEENSVRDVFEYMLLSMYNEKFKCIFWSWIKQCSRDTKSTMWCYIYNFLESNIYSNGQEEDHLLFGSQMPFFVDLFLGLLEGYDFEETREMGILLFQSRLHPIFIRAYVARMKCFQENTCRLSYTTPMYLTILRTWNVKDIEEVLSLLQDVPMYDENLYMFAHHHPADIFLFYHNTPYEFFVVQRWKELSSICSCVRKFTSEFCTEKEIGKYLGCWEEKTKE